MSFRSLNIIFLNKDEFWGEVDSALKGLAPTKNKKDSLYFESPKSFWKIFSVNKLEVLVAISKVKPESIYGLAKTLGRTPHHVLNDCNQLKSLGMIKLIETKGSRKQIRPELSFKYDFIKVESKLKEVLPISSKASQYLRDAV